MDIRAWSSEDRSWLKRHSWMPQVQTSLKARSWSSPVGGWSLSVMPWVRSLETVSVEEASPSVLSLPFSENSVRLYSGLTDFFSASVSLEKSSDIILGCHIRLLGLLHVKTGEERKRDQMAEPFFVQTSENTLCTSPPPRPEVPWGFTEARPTPLPRQHQPGCLGPGFLCPVKPVHGFPSVLQKYVGILICY